VSARLEVEELCVQHVVRRGLFGERGLIRAVDGVSFTVGFGETLALVGESASGKSSVARALLGLVPARGRVLGRREPGGEAFDLLSAGGRARRELGIVFQDPYESLNPRMSVGEAVAEPLAVHGLARGAELARRVRELFERVGLESSARTRYPHEFSGGQRQRLAIARALALGPKLLVCDEAVSALDASIRAQILNLLADLRAELGLSYLFITHDLALVRVVAERVAVMDCGRIVELGTVPEVFAAPAHPCTRALLAAVPAGDPRARRAPALGPGPGPAGERPSPLALPSGCPYRTRCPLAEARCAERYPERRVLSPTHWASCHALDHTAMP